MTKNTKIGIGVGVGILLLLWLRNRKRTSVSLKDTGAGSAGEDETQGGGGAIGGGGGGGISPNALGGANTIISPVVVGVPTPTLRPLFRQRPRPTSTSTGRGDYNVANTSLPVSRPVDAKPLPTTTSEVQPVSTKADTSFARFDGSFRSPSGLDFDGHIED